MYSILFICMHKQCCTVFIIHVPTSSLKTSDRENLGFALTWDCDIMIIKQSHKPMSEWCIHVSTCRTHWFLGWFMALFVACFTRSCPMFKVVSSHRWAPGRVSSVGSAGSERSVWAAGCSFITTRIDGVCTGYGTYVYTYIYIYK